MKPHREEVAGSEFPHDKLRNNNLKQWVMVIIGDGITHRGFGQPCAKHSGAGQEIKRDFGRRPPGEQTGAFIYQQHDNRDQMPGAIAPAGPPYVITGKHQPIRDGKGGQRIRYQA